MFPSPPTGSIVQTNIIPDPGFGKIDPSPSFVKPEKKAVMIGADGQEEEKSNIPYKQTEINI